MSTLLEPDICVVGGGAGGLAVASAAAQLGAKVVLVERSLLGGDNLHRGTIASKALIAAARQAYRPRTAKPFGLTPAALGINHRTIAEHVQSVVASVGRSESVERLAGYGVQVIRAAGKFESKELLAAGDARIAARNYVIATGSSPEIPAIQGLDRVGFLTNESLFAAAARFDSLLVLGDSGVALELAQAYVRLGSRVTVLARGRMLPEYDPEVTSPLLTRLREEGVVLAEGVSVTSAGPREGGGVRLIVDTKEHTTETVDGSHLLIMGARRPNVDGLGLEAAGIKMSPTGIRVSRGMRTSNGRVYAIGDVTGGPPYASLARHHAAIVLSRLVSGAPSVPLRSVVPLVTFTDPELAHMGLSERQARERLGRMVRVLRWPFSENDRAIAERRPEGYVKVIAGPTGRILGCTIVGESAGELIQAWSLAVSSGLTVGAVARSLAPYPTLAETSVRAAQGYTLRRAATSVVEGTLRLLWRFG